MRRLSIIDIKGGNQPIYNETRQVAVACNGEIYNYKELTKRLRERGHIFSTRSDAEVIVHLYEEYGLDFISHLNGMFAICLWDNTIKKLILARDRLGIKPLFYAEKDGVIFFASEISALMECGILSSDIDIEALNIYFSLYYFPEPYSVYKDIRRLPPGCYLELGRAHKSLQRYWDFDYGAQKTVNDESEGRELIVHTLRKAVSRQLQSEVPIGLFLSGGLDSASLAYFVVQELGAKLHTFTLGFPNSDYDERPIAKAIAKALGTNHHENVLTPEEVPSLFRKCIETFGEPNGNWSAMAVLKNSISAKSTATVILTGTGGDELMAGYPTITAEKIATGYRRLPLPIRRLLEITAKRIPDSDDKFPLRRQLKLFLRGAAGDSMEASFFRFKEIFTPEEKKNLFTQDFQKQLDDHFNADHVFKRYRDRYRSWDLVHKLLYLDSKIFLTSCSLHTFDHMMMSASIEGRVPFLDNEMLDLAKIIPANLKHKKFITKYIFRKSLRNVLPENILHLKKQGWTTPISIWMKNDCHDFVMDILSNDRLKKHAFLNAQVVKNIVNEHMEGQNDHSRKIGCLIGFMLWLDNSK